MKHVILGTAGHIDHGKTTLVKALTGTDTDRLPEEKARGITIDLGFARLQLGDLDIGIVDVPGHEGLVRNMLAGATGFDAVLLVVAADEGVMPQTREHVAIADLLGVRRIIVALTKSDLVEAEWLEMVAQDVKQLISTHGGEAVVVAVSSTTGAGIEGLRDVLVDELAAAGAREEQDLFRMPIDRVFTVRGTGTVVTGTIWSGRLSQQDIARVLPGEREVRVRAVQTHGQATESAGAGKRSAFALVGVDRDELTRGDCLVSGSGWRSVRHLTVRCRMIDGAELKQRQRVRVHLGTAEVMARTHLLADSWVQLRLEAPLVARVGDRFVLRAYSPVRTIGGGVVAEIERIRKTVTPEIVDVLERVLGGSPHGQLSAAVALRGEQGCSLADLPIVGGLSSAALMKWAGELPGDVARTGDMLFAAEVLTEAKQRLIRRVKRFHDARPLERGIERAELLAELPPVLGSAALEAAIAEAKLASAASLVCVDGFEPGFSPTQALLRDQIMKVLGDGGLAPPSVPELTSTFRSNEVRAVLRLLEAQGQVTQVTFDLYVNSAILADAVALVRSQLGQQACSAADFKTALPVSRKYLIPLLEYLDRTGVTRREGDLRWISS